MLMQSLLRSIMLCGLAPLMVASPLLAQEPKLDAWKAKEAEVRRLEAARQAREAAQVEMTVAREGTFPQEQATAESAIELAQADLANAEEQTRRVKADPAVWSDERIVAELRLERARFEQEQTEVSLSLLTNHEQPERLKTLEAELGLATARVKRAEDLLRLEQDRQRTIVAFMMKHEVKTMTIEDMVIAELDEAVALEAQVAAQVRELQALQLGAQDDPANRATLVKQWADRKARIQELSGQAKDRISGAIERADRALELREQLRRNESKRIGHRKILETLKQNAPPER
jgi:hypothetical protein